MTHLSKALLFSLAGLYFPMAAFANEPIDETRAIPADGHVLIENLAGEVEVPVWDRKEVHLSGDLGDDVEEVLITESTNGIQIRVRNHEGSRHIEDTDLVLQVPVGASVEVESVSADISVTGSEGKSIALTTVSGDITVAATPGRLELHSVSGDVEFEGVTSRTSVETVSGEITLDGVEGEVMVSTVSGDVSLNAGLVDRGRFEAVSGDLNVILSVSDDGRLNMDNMSGDVILRLPAAQQAAFTAQTFSGDIRSDFGEASQVSRGPGSLLQHAEGDSGASIRLENFSGDIHIRRQ
jgi:DUF4097 and DUF4098 domain-containing protein YvlB